MNNKMKNLLNIIALMLVLSSLVVTLIPGSVSFANSETFVFDNDSGTVHITYKDDADGAYRIYIVHGSDKISYPFFANGKTETFPLQFGNGEYSVSIMKNIKGTKYSFLKTEKFNLNLEDDKTIYLQSIQNIKWHNEDKPIRFAKNESKTITQAEEALKVFHKYIVEHVTYDFDKASSVQSDYIPSINDTFDTNKGICYDYSSLLASFMRSRGFPTRLVKGYSTNVDGYHAWNEIYVDGKWEIVDSTVDAGGSVKAFSIKPQSEYQKVYDY